MPTCPNCGEIVMNGDPYCPNCGTIFRSPAEYEENIIDEFKYAYNRAKRLYYAENYIKGFSMLLSASRNHKKMSDFEKSQVRAKPFKEFWVRELCCRTLNLHARYYREASAFIIEYGLIVHCCLDCDYIYPAYIDNCEKCGKPLESNAPTPEEFEELVREIFRDSFYSETQIDKMAKGTAELMKSNGCMLVEIRDMDYLNLDFIFEKEHKYFTTTYECEFLFEYRGMLNFTEFATKHNYDRLLADESFQKQVRDIEAKKGYRFRECTGGFGSGFDAGHLNFIFTDEINLKVRFDTGDGKIALYDIDFDQMKLSEYYVMEPDSHWGR